MHATPHNPSPDARRRGFTLAEMLVIVGIILIVLTIALPAFTAIIGSRSQAAARNVVAASLTRARAEAIRRGVPCGVFFYVDAETRQSALAVCVIDPLGDPDPYDRYKGLARGNAYQGGTFDPLTGVEDEPPMTSDRAVVLSSDVNGSKYATGGTRPRYAAFNGRPVVMTLKHLSDDVGGATNPGLTPAGDASIPLPNQGATSNMRTDNPASVANGLWGLVDTGSVELIDGIKPEILPAGVGLQVMRTEVLVAGASGPNANAYAPGGAFRERYTHAGLIAFAPDGRLVQTDWRIDAGSRLGRLIGGRYVGVPTARLQSQIGVVIYDQDKFDRAQSDATATQWLGSAVASAATPTVIQTFQTSDGDVLYAYPPRNPIPGVADEYAEERWLDANAPPLMVNRYSGVLVEAQ